MTGRIEETEFFTASSSPMSRPIELHRRKSGVDGTIVTLADGQPWLLARPTYQACRGGLTQPHVDGPLDRMFESTVLSEGLSLCDVWEVARELLKRNYDLSDDEACDLLSVAPGAECKALASAILDALFGTQESEKTYTAWIRASLLANGLGRVDIRAGDLSNVLAILVATNRTIPLSQFADACRLMDERARLEALI